MGMFDTVGKPGDRKERGEKVLKKLERMNKTLRHQEADRVPISDFFWGGFIRRWRKELGLADDANPYYYYDLDWITTVPNSDPHIRPFEIVREDSSEVVVKTGYGAIMRKKFDTPMPEFMAWETDTPGRNRQPGMPEYAGEYLDGFGNKITCWAVANPSFAANPVEQQDDKVQLTTRSAGFGIVRFNKPAREITMECWPRNVDITSPGSKQYAGWPKTIKMEDNYNRKAVAYLPRLQIKSMTDPVVQVVHELDDEIVYTLRIKGQTFRPKVFCKGSYTIHISRGNLRRTLKGIESLAADVEKTITVE